MTQGQAEHNNPVLEEASRELEAAAHDVQVAFDCIALGELNRAHTTALTARVAVDAAVTALQAALLTAGALPGPDIWRQAAPGSRRWASRSTRQASARSWCGQRTPSALAESIEQAAKPATERSQGTTNAA
jgi:hypothetical protein